MMTRRALQQIRSGSVGYNASTMTGEGWVPSIAIIGGTGPQGRGLALRLAAAGLDVTIGSRDAARAETVAAELADRLREARGTAGKARGADEAIAADGVAGGRSGARHASQTGPALGTITGSSNLAAAQSCREAVLAVPYPAQSGTLDALAEALAGKVLVTAVAPVLPGQPGVVRLPRLGSAAAEAQAQLGSATPIATAFQNVAAGKLQDLRVDIDCDVLVCADDDRARDVALRLASACGARGLVAGPLANAGVVEGLTSILIGLNVRHRARGTGVRITNLPDDRTSGA